MLSYKINNGNGILSRVISDSTFSNSLETTLTNLQNTSQEFSKFAVSMNNDKGALALLSNEEFSNGIEKVVADLQTSANQFAMFSTSMNDGNGALSRLVSDDKIGLTLDSTMSNLQGATKKLDENMEALQHNFLLRGFFKKKAKAEVKKAEDIKKSVNLKLKNDKRLAEEAQKKSLIIYTKDSLLDR